MSSYNDNANFSDLVGKTLTEVLGCTKGSDEVVFHVDTGEEFRMNHMQDCCESVFVEDITGDVQDLLNTPILQAEESESRDEPAPEYNESWTWTFYRITTMKGQVVLRWFGTSNGYYSESVSFNKISQAANT